MQTIVHNSIIWFQMNGFAARGAALALPSGVMQGSLACGAKARARPKFHTSIRHDGSTLVHGGG